MANLLLPAANSPRRLLSFWLVFTPGLAAMIATAASFWLQANWRLCAVVALAALVLPVLLKPTLARMPYRAWNKLVRIFGACASRFTLMVMFYILIAVGRAGSSLALRRPDERESQWVPRSALDPRAFFVQHRSPAKEIDRSSWAANLYRWSSKSRNYWVLALLPFLLLLSALDTEQEENYPTNIYTLF